MTAISQLQYGTLLAIAANSKKPNSINPTTATNFHSLDNPLNISIFSLLLVNNSIGYRGFFPSRLALFAVMIIFNYGCAYGYYLYPSRSFLMT